LGGHRIEVRMVVGENKLHYALFYPKQHDTRTGKT
jgi:hypothetical protein